MPKQVNSKLPQRAKEVTARLAGVITDGYAISRVTTTRTAGGANIIITQKNQKTSTQKVAS